MNYLDTLKQKKSIDTEYETQKELLLQAITDINILYSKHNGKFLKTLQLFIKTYENYESRKQIKLGQLLTEVSSNLEEQNK